MHEQVGEAGCEVGDKIIRDGAQSLLNLSRQLSVMVFLLNKRSNVKPNRREQFVLKNTKHENTLIPCSSLHAADL